MSFTFEKSLINLVIPDLPLVIEKTHQELCQGSTIIQSSDGNIFCIRCALKILQIPDQLRIRKKQILQSFNKVKNISFNLFLNYTIIFLNIK